LGNWEIGKLGNWEIGELGIGELGIGNWKDSYLVPCLQYLVPNT